jgi:hypothetical protein
VATRAASPSRCARGSFRAKKDTAAWSNGRTSDVLVASKEQDPDAARDYLAEFHAERESRLDTFLDSLDADPMTAYKQMVEEAEQ